MKRKLVKCAPHAYSELIRLDIPGPSGARPARLPFLRLSPLSVMKPSLPPVSKSSSSSVLEPFTAKPTKGELRAHLEVLAKKKRSVKQKFQASPKGCSLARGKVLKVGASSSPSSAVGAGDSSGRAVEPPLEVLPISIWSLTSQGAATPSAMLDEVRRDRSSAVGSEDSLLSRMELVAEAVSSILRDFDLKKVDALSVKEALALLLQGTASVRPRAFVDPFLYFFSFINSFLFFGRWLLTQKVWRGGPALPRAPPRRKNLIRLRLLP